MKNIILLLVLLLGMSCASQNIIHKDVPEETIPQEPKKEIKDGKGVHVFFQVYSGLIIATMIIILIKSPKQ